MHFYIFPVGDWSGDGHACVAEYLIAGDKPLADVRATHAAHHWIGQLCSEYDDAEISSHVFRNTGIADEVGEAFLKTMIAKHDLDVESLEACPEYNEEADDMITMTHEALIELWIFALNQLNPELNLEIRSEPMSTYYIKYKGYPVERTLIEGDIQASGRHEPFMRLDIPGYGVWRDYEGEFYMACN